MLCVGPCIDGAHCLLFAQNRDPFAELIRSTDPLSAEEERATFRVPEGFVVELVAAEPEILKPLNLAFDTRGRLWVTVTQEYPFPAPPDRPGRDAVKILEDSDGDGRADKVITFADGLNIPIGVYPYRHGAIVFSIPHIWYLEDTNGDDVADRRVKLYGPMGYERDTHGMNNAFRRGFDGWLYACHGFSNETRVAGSDGHQIYMHSGNTYRMRLDGSRVENFTYGQVNPFGMTFDEWFRIFTADCHSKPIYQLVRGGYYPSFGKPHDGLGFVPALMDHLHGSTAIAGVVCYAAKEFPQQYWGNFFSGNVMTSRINRNSVVNHGATLRCREEPDFLTTSDPWFRPVDLCLGPDGAIYVADFYNRIIGHYEVPLDHPGRDRTRGRIWRIRYVGSGTTAQADSPSPGRFDLSNADTATLIDHLGDSNLTRRMLAMDELSDRVGSAAVPHLIQAASSHPSPTARVHALWVLFRLNRLPEELLLQAINDGEALVRAHATRVSSELPQWTPAISAAVTAKLRDAEAQVRLAAADALGVHTEVDAAAELLDAIAACDPADSILIHTLRIALRNQCRHADRLSRLASQVHDDPRRAWLASICPALPGPVSAAILLDHLSTHPVPQAQLLEWARHVAANASAEQLDRLTAWVSAQFADQTDVQLNLLETVRQGLGPQAENNPTLQRWARSLAEQLWAGLQASGERMWRNYPAITTGNITNPWDIQERACADGKTAWFLSSLPRGEALTGRLRSAVFTVPPTLSFFLAGHDGFPDRPLQGKNLVRLCQAETGIVWKQQPAPRNDIAQRVQWDLSAWEGQKAYLEIIDGDAAGAYAWLAIGRFDPPVVEVPQVAPARRAEQALGLCQLVSRYRLADLRHSVRQLARDFRNDPQVQANAMLAELMEAGLRERVLLADAVAEPTTPEHLARQAITLLDDFQDEVYQTWVAELMHAAPAAAQQRFAETLAASHAGIELLLSLVERGVVSAAVLQRPKVQQLISATANTTWQERIAQLTAGIPEARTEIVHLIQARQRAYLEHGGQPARGTDVFRRVCSACHQLAGQGAVVGPQLDGIGNRGLERLLEDILDPHRNVDVAFRTVTLQLKDGRVHVGLPRGKRGALLVFANQKGEEFLLAPDEIEQQIPSTLSLMPDNVTSELTEQEFCDLLAFLLEQRK